MKNERRAADSAPARTPGRAKPPVHPDKKGLLRILRYPDPRLLTVAQPVTRFDQELAALLDAMARTMYAADGIGLAATQVGVHVRALVADVSDTGDRLIELINPHIVSTSGSAEFEEGCLSVPGVYRKIRRARALTVRAQSRDGRPLQIQAQGLLAMCLQHEIDHLEGRVFIEHFAPSRRQRV